MEKEPRKTELADNENLINEIKWHGIIKTGVRILNQKWSSKGYNDGYECMRILKGTFNVYCKISASVLQKPLFKVEVYSKISQMPFLQKLMSFLNST